MQPVRRTAARSAQRLRLRSQQSQRRFAGDHHGPELVSEGQAAHAKHPPNKNESFGVRPLKAIILRESGIGEHERERAGRARQFGGDGTNTMPRLASSSHLRHYLYRLQSTSSHRKAPTSNHTSHDSSETHTPNMRSSGHGETTFTRKLCSRRPQIECSS